MNLEFDLKLSELLPIVKKFNNSNIQRLHYIYNRKITTQHNDLISEETFRTDIHNVSAHNNELKPARTCDHRLTLVVCAPTLAETDLHGPQIMDSV